MKNPSRPRRVGEPKVAQEKQSSFPPARWRSEWQREGVEGKQNHVKEEDEAADADAELAIEEESP